MKRIILVGTCSAVLLAPVAAHASTPSHRHVGVYLYLRRHVIHTFGVKEAGRNVIRDGLSTGKVVTDYVVRKSIQIYERALYYVAPHPPAPAAYAKPTSYQAPIPITTSPAYNGGYSIPSYIVQCESHGNWNAVNPSSGAGGAYQIIQTTWQAYGGTGSPASASPAEQSSIAAKIYASQGASAWSCG